MNAGSERPPPGVEVWPGEPFELGATYDGAGTNFALFSEAAEGVDLCLFDDDGRETRVPLPEVTGFVWHGYLPRIRPGQRYGFRVHGPFDLSQGLRCNPHKLLLDPYARAIEGEVVWGSQVYGQRPGTHEMSTDDSAGFVPKSVVTNPYFDWGDDRLLRTPWHETVIYEAHVRGLTMSHPGVPEHLRGTYAGVAHPAVLEHLTKLGVTAVELMPVHSFLHDHRLHELGLRNYWGYNSIGYFAPHAGYASNPAGGEPIQEFRTMVRDLHAAGIEVILDVVYNHTGEGDHRGPTLSFRGIDNAAYYRLDPNDGSRYVDYTGTGNSLNMRSPYVLQLIMDSLRYWVTEMHVDGFRFDLAATLARELHDVDRLASFFDLIQQDPVIRRCKLIAEPWDVGEGGYQVGNFPPLWSEWNGKYRDTVREFVAGWDRTLAEFAFRFTGSSDLYRSNGRLPHASINFVTCHDGFTLRDLVSYNEKHNHANGEDNRDGESHNRSWNCGVEGPSNDGEINTLRARQQRNFLSLLFLSQGVPMLLAGDEIGRSQRGNNNAYCQDNDIGWIDWEDADESLQTFVMDLIALRKAHPIFRRRRWFEGSSVRGDGLTDIGWFKPDGTQMSADDWNVGYAKALGVFLNGGNIPSRSSNGSVIVDDSFYLIVNAGPETVDFAPPEVVRGRGWVASLDTYQAPFIRDDGELVPASDVSVPGRTVELFRCPRAEGGLASVARVEPNVVATEVAEQVVRLAIPASELESNRILGRSHFLACVGVSLVA